MQSCIVSYARRECVLIVVAVSVETVVRDGWQKDRVVGWAGTVCTEVPIEVHSATLLSACYRLLSIGR